MNWLDEMLNAPEERGLSIRDLGDLRWIMAEEGFLEARRGLEKAIESCAESMKQCADAFGNFGEALLSSGVLREIQEIELGEAVENDLSTRKDWTLPEP